MGHSWALQTMRDDRAAPQARVECTDDACERLCVALHGRGLRRSEAFVKKFHTSLNIADVALQHPFRTSLFTFPLRPPRMRNGGGGVMSQ